MSLLSIIVVQLYGYESSRLGNHIQNFFLKLDGDGLKGKSA